MPAHAKINFALAAAMLTAGATLEDTAAKVGAKTANSLRVALQRRNITRRNVQLLQSTNTKLAHASDPAQAKGLMRASNELRAVLAGFLSNHVGALAKVPAKANLKHLRAVGEAVEPFARTAKIVHGWDSSDKTGLLLEMCDPGAVIELEPAKVACGPDTPMQSVPSPAAIEDRPQDTQVDETQDNAS